MQEITGHIPFACSGAQIKNFDLALQRALSQQIANRSNIVAAQKFFLQIVLDIHSLYASRWIDGSMIRKGGVRESIRRAGV
jgi:hypothetical protein